MSRLDLLLCRDSCWVREEQFFVFSILAYANFANALVFFSAGVNTRFRFFLGAVMAATTGAATAGALEAPTSSSESLSNEMNALGARRSRACMLMMDNEREIGIYVRIREVYKYRDVSSSIHSLRSGLFDTCMSETSTDSDQTWPRTVLEPTQAKRRVSVAAPVG